MLSTGSEINRSTINMAEENLGLVEKEVEGKVKGVLFDTLKELSLPLE